MSRIFLSYLVLAIGILASFQLQNLEKEASEAKAKARFYGDCQIYSKVFREQITARENLLLSLKTFFAASTFVSRKEFEIFASELLKTTPGVISLEWIPRIPQDLRNEYEEKARSEGMKGYEFWDLASNGKRQKAKAREFYHPVYYASPKSRNQKALGLEISSSLPRFNPLLKVKSTEKPVISEPLELLQGTKGFLWFYKKDDNKTNQNLPGVLLAAISYQELLNQLSPQLRSLKLRRVFLEDLSGGEKLCAMQDILGSTSNRYNLSELKNQLHESLRFFEEFELGGRQWRLTILPGEYHLGLWNPGAQNWVLFLGLLISVLLFLIFFGQSRKMEFAQSLVKIRTNELFKLNEQLELEKQNAESANQAKTDFLASLSHEFKTPIHGIHGMNSLLMNTPLNDEQKDHIHSIESSANILLSMVNNLLDYSKIQKNNLKLESKDFDLVHLMRDLISSYETQTNENRNLLSLHIDANIPVLRGDPDRIRQVVLNLLSNANKFTSGGKIHVSVESIDDVGGKHSFLVKITDSGVGIGKHRIPLLFDAFNKPESPINQSFEGAGLGLFICKQLILLMEGEISVKSEPEQGSEFTILLSLPHGDIDSIIDSNHELKVENQNAFQDKKILVVDDNPTNLVYAFEILKNLGCSRVDRASSGREALHFQEERGYDMIFLDIHMPELDGIEVTKQIRKSRIRIHQPVIIAVSANSQEEIIRACYEAGIEEFLSKPARPEDFLSMLNMYFNQYQGEELKTETPPDISGDKDVQKFPVIPLYPNLDQSTFEMLQSMDNDGEFLISVFQSFLEHTEELIVKLKEAVNEQDLDSIKFNSHAIKGSARNLGFFKLSELLQTLEDDTVMKNTDRLPQLMQSVETEFQSAISWIQRAMPS